MIRFFVLPIILMIFTICLSYFMVNKGWYVYAYLICVNFIAFVYYGWDKYKATSNSQHRIPEKKLLAFAIAGGIPGSLLGQYIYRHKTQKQPFRAIFWFITMAYTIGFLAIVLFS